MATATGSPDVVAGNAESRDAWDGPLFERFVRYRHIIVAGLARHGEAALRRFPPPHGGRVLDIGCGFGDTAQRIAWMVGPEGSVLGVDVAPRFIEAARAESAEAEVGNVSFRVADVQAAPLEGGPFDFAFSRMGTMFFANPMVALRNVREVLAPGGRLVMVVWRRREDNGWLHRAQTVVEKIVPRPEEYDEPTCGPGPFSLAGADTVTDVLLQAGYANVSLHRCEEPMLMGRDVEEAIDIVMAIGPAGEILRLAGERAAHRHDEVRVALREALGEWTTPEGVIAPASTWIVSADAG